jgi:Aspartate/tyrosine/aromatic aminotransferase
MPCAGTREALFHLALAAVPEWQGQGPRPAVLMPSPFYHVYAGAAAVAGAEPVFLPATPANGFLPEPELVDRRRSPARLWPMSARPPTRKGRRLARLSRPLGEARPQALFRHRLRRMLCRDLPRQPPAGALEVAEGSLDNLIVLHSLSKRSAAPGLRSGFIAGDRR